MKLSALMSWLTPDWVAVGVAVLTLVCVLYQLRLERRQTRLAEEQTRLAHEQIRLAQRQNEIVEKQNMVLESERARRTALVMYRKGDAPTEFRFYLKNAGDKVAREFVAQFWLPETVRTMIGMWDPGGNMQIPGPVERSEIQGIGCMRYQRSFETILFGDSEQGAFYFSINHGQPIAPGTRVFWKVTTSEGEVSPGNEPGAIEIA